MVGYPESLTDPSYKGQILVITFPIIGIYGVPNDDKDEYGFLKNYESDNIHIKALIISDYSNYFQHYNSIKSLSTWLKENKIPAIYDVDTRALTKYIRNEGIKSYLLASLITSNSKFLTTTLVEIDKGGIQRTHTHYPK